jgi:hypothetical protein
VIIPSERRESPTLPIAIACAAAMGGALAAWHYHQLGLTLTHYDARGHLVVARRIVDNITPGWQQIGAVWLPLPHLLNALPVQIDLLYRTGASAVAISVVSFAIAAGAIAWIVRALTESTAAALAATVVFGLNPNVVYLQATPMTEPLLLASLLAAIAMLIAWADADTRPKPRGAAIGIAFALACLTRYEAWPVTAAALAAAGWIDWRRGHALAAVRRDVSVIALAPLVAVLGFTVFSRVVVGQWFVGGDFFVPENKALGDPVLALEEIGWGTLALSGAALPWIGAAGVAVALASAIATPHRRAALLAASLATMAVVPWAAFVHGHPFRIRYVVPLIAVEAIGVGLAAAIVPSRRAAAVCAVALIALAARELRPFDATAPMLAEAQWDVPNTPARARVTACIGRLEQGAKIMASMGSLGHYMQEASRAGFALRDFLHEGNGDIWLAALERPLPFAEWLLIEEKAQGGDRLAKIARDRPDFLDGYQRTCDGAGMALYRRTTKGSTGENSVTDGTRGKN